MKVNVIANAHVVAMAVEDRMLQKSVKWLTLNMIVMMGIAVDNKLHILFITQYNNTLHPFVSLCCYSL